MTAATKRRTPAEIEENLLLTRERLARDVGALQEKLSPDNVKRHVRETVRRTVLDNVGTLIRLVKKNPVPSLMIGAGVGWFLVRKRD
jgi:hypothetical protein